MSVFRENWEKVKKFKLPSSGKWAAPVKRDRLLLAAFFFWLALITGSLVTLFVFFRQLPPEVPLYFTRLWGEARLAPKLNLWLLPAGSTLLGLFNFSAGVRLYPTEPFLSRTLFLVSVVVALLAVLTLVNIILLMI